MALAVEGTTQVNSASASTINVSLSTSGTNRIVRVVVLTNGAPVTSVTSANLTFALKAASPIVSSIASIEVWDAPAASQITSETITVNTTNSGYLTVLACAVSGANFSDPYDANASNHTTGTSGSGTITTDAASTIIFGLFRSGSSATTTNDAAWTGIDSNQFLMVEYKLFSSAQSGLTVPVMTNTTTNGWIVSAIKEASAASGNPWYYYAQQ